MRPKWLGKKLLFGAIAATALVGAIACGGSAPAPAAAPAAPQAAPQQPAAPGGSCRRQRRSSGSAQQRRLRHGPGPAGIRLLRLRSGSRA